VVIRSGERDLEDVTTMRGNDETAASRMTRILHDAYGNDLPDAVIATHDEIARGVAAALMEAGAVPGEGFPLITGRGAELRSLAALVDGRQFSTLLEDPRALGEAAADVVLGLATPSADMDGVPALLVPGASVRVDDIDEVVVGSGYWSRERVDEAIQEYGLPPVLVLSPTPTATPAP
jgi:putative multiple sugar transport system substrate-binding protein